jgi:hypothetical protein
MRARMRMSFRFGAQRAQPCDYRDIVRTGGEREKKQAEEKKNTTPVVGCPPSSRNVVLQQSTVPFMNRVRARNVLQLRIPRI